MLVVLVGLVMTTRSAHAEPWYRGEAGTRRLVHLGLAAGAGALYVASETVLKPTLAPDPCRWCEPGALDDRVRNALVWGNPEDAVALSNIAGYVSAPILMLGLTGYASASAGDAGRVLDDAIPILETVVYSQLIVQAVKFSVGRQRPYAHYTTDPDFMRENEDNLSFFSGHSALTFGLAVSAGVVVHRRGYAIEPVIWGIGLTVAASTAYFRVAGDKHYLTDVVAGSAFGAAAGIFVPRLTGMLPDNVAIVPDRQGVAITGTF